MKTTLDHSEFKNLKSLLKKKELMAFKVVTGSMEPVIKTSTPIQVVPMADPLKVFDIIVFWNGHVLICHYVRHVNHLLSPEGERIYITGGISLSEDLPVMESRILGVVRSHSLPLWLRLKIVFQRLVLRKYQ